MLPTNMSTPSRKKKLLSNEHSSSPKHMKIEEESKENISPAFIQLLHSPSVRRSVALMGSSENGTPKKNSAMCDDPATPNTNIKLLTSLAATLDYVSCDTPKSKYSKSVSTMQENPLDASKVSDCTPMKTTRKEKSLAIICSRFLQLYPLFPPSNRQIVVSLDEASSKLSVERRRLYDIVNVFESVEMLQKTGKNQYIWYGKNNLHQALQKIKNSAVQENMFQKLRYVLDSEEILFNNQNICILDDVEDFNRYVECKSSPLVSNIPPVSPFPELRKEKSLAMMSQKFLMLFLVSPSKIISLGVAAKVLNGFQKNERSAQTKTQIRRLYDIANVLSSIGLITKDVTLVNNSRKPAFKYIGPDFDNPLGTPSSSSRHSTKGKPRSLVRHSSFQEICAVAEMEHQRLKFEEAPKSAPPFENNMTHPNSSFHKTSFTNLRLGSESPCRVGTTKVDNAPQRMSPLCTPSPTLRVGQFSANKNIQICLQRPVVQLQPRLKLVNVSKQLVTIDDNYYLVNQNPEASSSSRGPVFILNTPPTRNITPAKQLEQNIEAKQTAPKTTAGTMELSSTQRDSILKSLNLSLSDGQMAAIQLAGAPKSQDIRNPRRSLLQIINKHEVKEETMDVPEDLSNYSNPSSGVDSPVSILSGYSTPTSNHASNFSEVDFVSDNRQDNSVDSASSCRRNENVALVSKSGGESKINNTSLTQKLVASPNDAKLIQNDDSNSSNANSEVAKILRSTLLGERYNRHAFLIDEKTILSPL